MQVVNQVTGAELVLDYHLIPARTDPVQRAAFMHNNARRAEGHNGADFRRTRYTGPQKSMGSNVAENPERVPSVPSFNVGLSPARAGPVLLQEVCDLRHGCRHRAARQNPPPATRWWATNFEYVTIWEMSGSSHRCIQFTALSHPMSLVGRWQNQAGVLLLKRLEPRLSSKGSVHEALPDSKASACHASVGPLPSQPCC